MKRLIFILFSVFIFSFIFVAQDSHYWTEQYGTRSMLLSNSIIGSVEDLGAVFYNPARLGLIENPAFIISAKVYQLDNTVIENAIGDNTSLKKSEFGGAPSLVAGTFKINWLEKENFSYAFLTRSGSDIDVSSRVDVYGDVIDGIPGDEFFAGEISVGKSFKEEWMGVTWAHAFNSHFSLGLSSFFSTRNQSANNGIELKTYSEAKDVDVFLLKRRYSYSHYGLLWKIGMAWEYQRLKFGVTITTPTLSLKGDGSFHYENIYTGVNTPSMYVVNLQSGIETKYHTPWSVGAGFSTKFLKGILHLSGEYFSKINKYNQLVSEPFIGQSSGEEMQLTLYNELNSVINFGVGYELSISERISTYISFSTDKSASVGKSNNEDIYEVNYLASTFTSNINHFGVGVVMHFKGADITLGTTNASARYQISRPIDFPDDDDHGKVINPDSNSTVDWSRWHFIVGISIPFFDDVAKKWEKKFDESIDKKRKKKKKDQNKEKDEDK